MDVTILGNKKNIDVISVIVSTDKEDIKQEKLHMFFCCRCQNPLFRYMGRIVTITPGSTPLSLPILLRCGKCKINYQIEDII